MTTPSHEQMVMMMVMMVMVMVMRLGAKGKRAEIL